MVACAQEASSSGLTIGEKKYIPKVRGKCGLAYYRFLIYKDIIGIPVISPIFEDDPIHWGKELPPPVLQYATSPPSSPPSEHTDEEIIIEDMAVEEVQSDPQVEEVAESIPRQSTFEKHSSQPLALTVVHPTEQPQTSRSLDTVPSQAYAQDSAESSRPSLSLPPNFEEIIGIIIDERVESKVKEQVKEQVDEALVPTNIMMNQMMNIMLQFQQSQNLPTQIPPPPPNPNPPPPPPPSSSICILLFPY